MTLLSMTPARFEQLAETYGATIARWPTEHREPGTAFAASNPEYAGSVLAKAEALDAVLDGWVPLAVSHELRERIVAGAGRPRSFAAWFWGAGVGAGFAAACAAGLMFGVSLSSVGSSVASGDEPVSAVMTSFELPGPAETMGAAI